MKTLIRNVKLFDGTALAPRPMDVLFDESGILAVKEAGAAPAAADAVVDGTGKTLTPGLKRRGAGIKTHVLVCLGSALVMLTSEYMFRTFPSAKADMARMGAQVISGVGFLGVGTIMVTGRNQVRGLTTAACLWVCACEGLAAGIGFVDGAVYGLILIAVTLKLLTRVDTMIHEHAKVFDF